MESPCPVCGVPNPARAKFCLECGTRVAEVSAVTEAAERRATGVAGERRVVSVVFADLSGFTAFSERTDPEEVRALADEAALRLGEIVQRYGGMVDKIIGDCVMAVFGAPVSHEDDPERAVRAAIDMQAYVTEHSEKFARLPLRIGVNTGETMFAPVGPQGQYTVLGDTVNTAARLQSAAAKGEILIGEETYRGAREAVELEPVPPITAKGKEEPVPAWRAVGVKGARPARTASRSPFVGRALQFDRLWELWERARTESRPYLVSVMGAPGIGKTRLVGELTRRLEGAATVSFGRCLSYGEGITYWPVVEIVKELSGILLDDEPAAMSSKLGRFLEGLGTEDLDQLRTMAVALSNLIGVQATPRGTYSAGELTQGELHWGIRRVFELVAAKRPLVLVVEDLHWAEPTLLDLLTFLLEGGADAPLFVIGTSRPELAERGHPILTASWNRRVLDLEALTADESEALLAELVGGPGGEGLATLLRAAGGNPLFLEEIVRMLGESGALGPDGRPVPGATERIAVPTSLHGLIASRLDGLPTLERRVAQHASVIGQVFWPTAVAYVAEADGEIDRGVEGLEERDLVNAHQASAIAGEREYEFKHKLIQDVAYERLPKGQRAGLHARCGAWVAALPGVEDEFVEIVAYHLEQACVLASEVTRRTVEPPVLQAVRALSHAAEKAERHEGTREADGFYRRAIALVGRRFPETATELRLRRSGALKNLGDLRGASAELAGVAEDARAFGRPDLRCEALLGLANIDHKHAIASRARERLVEASAIAVEIGDARLRIRANYELATLRGELEGSAEEGVAALREAIPLAERLDDLPLRMEGHLRLGTLLLNMGRLEEAEAEYSACASLAAERGGLREEARASHFIAYIRFYRGETEQAEELELRVTAWLERIADRILQLQALRLLARIAMSRGDLGLAEERLQEALPLALEAGGWLVVEIYRYLAEALARQGKAAEASEAVEGARASLPEESRYSQAAVLISEAFLAEAEGDRGTARERFAAALPFLDDPGLSVDLAEARMAFAGSLIRFGATDEAQEHLALARATLEPMGAKGLLAEIDREIGTARGAGEPAPR